MNDTLQTLMREATRLTQSGQLKEATAIIQRALGSAGSAALAPASVSPASATRSADSPSGIVLDGCVFEVGTPNYTATEATIQTAPHASSPHASANSAASPPMRPPQGEFTEGSHTHATLTRRYKLYTPPDAGTSRGKHLPLVVMLHGCTQNPDDFAAGTGMNRLAREEGFYVLYPAQSADANPQRCWNWFKHTHQSRGRGEAALLADMTLSIMQQNSVDPQRVYIAGLSAGGAMAAIMGAAYSDIYAAVGVHSGLAVGAASNVSEALAAMKSGVGRGKAVNHVGRSRAVPTIVFHGDQDSTVHPCNGEQVTQQALSALSGGSAKHVAQGASAQGRRFTRTVYLRSDDIDTSAGFGADFDNDMSTKKCADVGPVAAASGTVRSGPINVTLVEHWLVHGAGHAWSGGDAKGSYTDPKGPDASREMLRFFLAHSLSESRQIEEK